MKTLLLTALTFTSLVLCPPEAQARDRKHYDSSRYSSQCESPSSDYGYYRSDCGPRVSYSRSYYRPEPIYYRPAPRYYYTERCEPERRRSFRSPLLSFFFGF